jgi:ABC-type glycerol-3-phosphate transport system permease component
LLNNPIGLIAVHSVLALPLCLWMLQSYLEGVPREPEEAAMVFGASRARAFRVATLPLAAPGILASAAFAFILSWGEYMFAFIMSPDPSRKTVPVALKDLFSSYAMDWGVVTAAGVVATIPVLLLFWLMAKYLAAGLAKGAFD